MKTRERILHTSLALFNELGEPNVTTLLIADEMDISPGNLYYHFKSKTDILNELFSWYEEAMLGILVIPDNEAEVEDHWFHLHLIFENIEKFQFLYRDLVTIMAKYPHLEKRFQKILSIKRKASRTVLCRAKELGRLDANDSEIEAIIEQIVLITTFWLSYSVINEGEMAEDALARGVYQVMSVVAPFMEPERREMINALKETYL